MQNPKIKFFDRFGCCFYVFSDYNNQANSWCWQVKEAFKFYQDLVRERWFFSCDFLWTMRNTVRSKLCTEHWTFMCILYTRFRWCVLYRYRLCAVLFIIQVCIIYIICVCSIEMLLIDHTILSSDFAHTEQKKMNSCVHCSVY